MLDKLRNIRIFGMTPGDLALLAILLVTGVGPLLLDALPNMLPAGVNIPRKVFVILFIVTVIAMGALYRHQVRHNRKNLEQKQKGMESELARLRDGMANLAIEQILELAMKGVATELDKDIENYRTNIMLIESNKLVIRFHHGMENAPDLNIELEKHQGCAGQVWGSGEQMAADLPPNSSAVGPSWNLTREQEKVTSELRSILSTPIFDPENSQKVLGVFNIDSKLCLSEAGLLDKSIPDKAADYASMFGHWLQWIQS